ncbi:hypothetical protein NKH83_02070 [Mesorhizobium sp. M0909]
MRLLIAGTSNGSCTIFHATALQLGNGLVDVVQAKAKVMPPRQAEAGAKIRVYGALGSAGACQKLKAEAVIHCRRKKDEGHIVARRYGIHDAEIQLSGVP